jgi:YVTN family beta-propeller protein
VEFRILGPLQLLDTHRDVRLGSPKERALLALLLLRQGAVPREWLIEALWGESPPPTAARADACTVSRIDPATNRVTATIPVGGVPSGLAFGDDMLWVSSQASGA